MAEIGGLEDGSREVTFCESGEKVSMACDIVDVISCRTREVGISASDTRDRRSRNARRYSPDEITEIDRKGTIERISIDFAGSETACFPDKRANRAS